MIVFVIAVLVLFLLFFVIISTLSNLVLYPPRQPLSRNPGDYDLPFEEVSFLSSDHLTLKGWWIPCGVSDRAVILLHPMFGNRHGLPPRNKPWPIIFQKEIDLLKVARTFHGAGWSILLFDFRSHGESPRRLCGGGLTEDQDVTGAVDYTFNRLATNLPSGETIKVGVAGFGLGAAAVLAAVGRMKGQAEKIMIFSGDMEGGAGWTEIQPPNIKLLRFVISIQPISSDYLLYECLKGISPLSEILVPLVDWLGQKRGGYPLNGDLLRKAAREVHLPVLVVLSRSSLLETRSGLQSLYEALPGPKCLELVEESSSLLEACYSLAEKPQSILDYAIKLMSN
jgi:pimeloyl-ACP methyl ester carboxylesterase